jgi:spermidine synthase
MSAKSESITATTEQGQISQRGNLFLLLAIFIIAICGLVYELLAGAMSSYLLGDSIYQFSIVIGLFMSSMGLGSFISRYIERKLPVAFIMVELMTGLLGGFSTVILFFAFAKLDNYSPFLFIVSTGIGTLVGLEIPLVLRILKQYSSLKIVISNVMTADYIGALVGAILFPIIFVPYLGMIQTGMFFGLANVIVAGIALRFFKPIIIAEYRKLTVMIWLSALLLLVGFFSAGAITGALENSLYNSEIIYSQRTPYQRIVLTSNGDDISMFINGSIQFCSKDEYRYHESLVHPAMAHIQRYENILVLGGGDGMVIRELLKYKAIGKITLVDLDPAVTKLFSSNQLLRKLNNDSLNDSRVTVINADAWKFIEKQAGDNLYDLIIMDLPDPHGIELSKLYSKSFFSMLASHLAVGGAIVTQSSSPLFSRKAFWCIAHTLADVDNPYQLGKKLHVMPYHCYIPSFGEWGFIIATPMPVRWSKLSVKIPTKFLTPETLSMLPVFPKDISEIKTDINRINTHKLVDYYESGWSEWYQ